MHRTVLLSAPGDESERLALAEFLPVALPALHAATDAADAALRTRVTVAYGHGLLRAEPRPEDAVPCVALLGRPAHLRVLACELLDVAGLAVAALPGQPGALYLCPRTRTSASMTPARAA